MPKYHRSVAFSNKQKKEQLKAKREKKKMITNSSSTECSAKQIFSSSFNRKEKFQDLHLPMTSSTVAEDIDNIPSKNSRYNLKFRKDGLNPKQCKRRYELVISLSPNKLEEDIASFFPPDVSYPQRPVWKKTMNRAELDGSEKKNFKKFCENVDKKYSGEEISLYELNLETWRQLWRVTEMSDILLIIVDARYAVAQFPPCLYHQLLERENKGVILILNKCDLVPPSLVVAWQDYFIKKFPRLHVLPFCSIESNSSKKRTNFKMSFESSLRLVKVCQEIVENKVDLSSWKKKIKEERNFDGNPRAEVTEGIQEESEHIFLSEEASKIRYKGGVLTIGTIGHPNVGKSSLINALMGKKVVSVSKTPGHTKHFQTIFLTKEVKLCDCPGLVFPSLCPKQLQIVVGSYPIAQVRDPMTTVGYIAERLDIPTILKLNPPHQDFVQSQGFKWSPFDICEGWALKRRYMTRTKGGNPDVYRAANEILRLALVGHKGLAISLKPPNFLKNKASYDADSRQDEVKLIQGVHCGLIGSDDLVAQMEVSDLSDLSEDESSCDEETTSSDLSEDACSSDENESVLNDNKFSLLDLNE